MSEFCFVAQTAVEQTAERRLKCQVEQEFVLVSVLPMALLLCVTSVSSD